MNKLCILWVTALCCIVEVACDDTTQTNNRVPQINFGGEMTNIGEDGGTTEPLEVCERTFMFTARGSVPQEVKVAGTFEEPPWSGSITLNDEDGDGTWITQVPVATGEHQYKWIVDGQWLTDLDNPSYADDGAGGLNSIFIHECPFEPSCTANQDCEDNDVCRGYRCVTETRPILCDRCPEDCNEQTGECIEAIPPECEDSSSCSAPLICEDGRCVPECQSDVDCTDIDATALCIDLSCVVPECESDEGCDPLTESCTSFQCQPKPCNEHVFIFDPQGEVYDSIHVAGEFNAINEEGDWPTTVAEGGWAMTLLPDGRYYARQNIPNGSYAYKFVLWRNGTDEWIADPQATLFVSDGFDGQNSILELNCEDQAGQCGELEEFRWEDAIMYFVMVDRFYNSDNQSDPVANVTGGDAARGPSGQYEGGDLAGVDQKLSYLTALGVNALWLSAPYENRNSAGAAIDPNRDPNTYSGYHGYWPSPANIDFTDSNNPNPRPQVESRIGTETDLTTLITNAHEQDVKVLFDYVMNHVDSESGLAQAHPSWFARKENGQIALCGPENYWNDPYWGTRCAFTDYLPPFDFDNVEAREWSVKDALWWAKTYDIDGYRLDAIKHVPLSWLEDLRLALNENFPEPTGGRFYLVGETFAYDDPGLLRLFVDPETLLDGQFDFPFKARLCEALFRPDGRLDSFANWMTENDRFYGPGALMTTWIGNHDIPRAIHFASREIGNCREGSSPQNGWYMSYPQPTDASAYERLGLAFAVMMTNPGIPLIYYGDEIGLAGGGDPDNRRLMPWDDQNLSSAQLTLRNQVTRLSELRTQYRNLSRGRRVTLSSSQDTWVYQMLGCGGDSPTVTVAINRADSPRSINIPSGSYQDVLNNESIMGGELQFASRSLKVLITQ